MSGGEWRDGYEAGRAELLRDVAQLRGLVRELATALDGWSDSKDDLVLEDLLVRAKKAGKA